MSLFTPSQSRQPAIYNGDPRMYHVADAIPKGQPGFVMSRSELARFARCPSRWLRLPAEEKTPAMEWGSLLDTIVLNPELFEKTYAVAASEYPATPTKKGAPEVMKPWNWNATFCDDWRTEQQQAGKEVVKSGDAALAWKAAKRFNADPVIARVLACSKRQVVFHADYHDVDDNGEPLTGLIIPVKCMIDLLPDPDSEFGECIADFKTTDDASPRSWERTVASQNYALQAALYLDIANAVLGSQYYRWLFLVQECEEPWETARRELFSEWIDLGRTEYRRWLQWYCKCLSTGRFPSYDDPDSFTEPPEHGFRTSYPPAWLLNQIQ